jgi:putative transposase
MITDKLARYGAAKREVMPGIEHRQHKGLNNPAENSHQPTRRRERQMKQFKSVIAFSQPTIRSTTSSTFPAITTTAKHRASRNPKIPGLGRNL